MFQFPRLPARPWLPKVVWLGEHCSPGFPHSDIHGSTLAGQLPVAFRGRAASFFGPRRLGIHLSPSVASLESLQSRLARALAQSDKRQRVCSLLAHPVQFEKCLAQKSLARAAVKTSLLARP